MNIRKLDKRIHWILWGISPVLLIGVFWVLLWLVISLSMRPQSISATSPDGKFEAQFWVENGFLGFSDVGTTHFEIIDHDTGQKNHIAEWSYSCWDGYIPLTIIWNSDSRRVACVGREEMGLIASYPVSVQKTPFMVVSDESREDWLRNDLKRRVKMGNAWQRGQAEEILLRLKYRKP